MNLRSGGELRSALATSPIAATSTRARPGPRCVRNLGRYVPAVRGTAGARPAVRNRPALVGARRRRRSRNPKRCASSRTFWRASSSTSSRSTAFPTARSTARASRKTSTCPTGATSKRLQYTDQLADLLAELLPDRERLDRQRQHRAGRVQAERAHARGRRSAWSTLMVRHAAHLVQLRARTGKHITLGARARAVLLPRDGRGERGVLPRSPVRRRRRSQRLCELTGLDAAQQRSRRCAITWGCASICAMRRSSSRIPQGCRRAARSRRASACTSCRSAQGCGCPSCRRLRSPACASSTTRCICIRWSNRGPAGWSATSTCPRRCARRQGRALDGGSGACTATCRSSSTTWVRSRRPRRSSARCCRLHRAEPISTHLEVETYTWNVLPPHAAHRTTWISAIARELAWVREELDGAETVQLTAAVSVAVKLGRISNLPTVWTNTLVGVTLAGRLADSTRACRCCSWPCRSSTWAACT